MEFDIYEVALWGNILNCPAVVPRQCPYPKISSPKSYNAQDNSLLCPGHVLDLSLVFRSNLEYPPSPGCQSGPMWILIQVLVWYPTVSGVLEGIWTISDIPGKPYGYGAQLHLEPHPRHARISPSFQAQVSSWNVQHFLGDGVWSKEDDTGWNMLSHCCMSLWWCIYYVWQILWVKGGLALSPTIPHICSAICPGFQGQEVGIYSLSWVVE